MTFRELKNKFTAPVIWGNLLAMVLVVALLLGGVWEWLNIYTQHGEEVTVPNVEGTLYADARNMLGQLGLEAVVADSAYDRSLPAGIVLKQRPQSGTLVKSNRPIQLTINSSEMPTLELPSLANNSSLREAQEILKQYGFRLGPVEYVDGEERDWVVGVKCQGREVYSGDRIPRDAAVVLRVGNGMMVGDSIENDIDMDGDVSLDEMINQMLND